MEHPSADAQGESQDRAGGLGILVVDDDSSCLESLEDLLSQEGHEVVTAGGGREALDVARRLGRRDRVVFQLSILDFNMPDLTGIEVYRELSRQLPGLGAIFISGAASPALERRVRSAGGFALVPKPLDLWRVREAVGAFRGWWLAGRSIRRFRWAWGENPAGYEEAGGGRGVP